ncbi:M23 family metallopeptidase [Woodsholea maritima]|uniref:M23 family metallopeptidase n=1 Tax=Woodsholea maritima TaxID=240237 RepID=UPI000368EF1D|nr:M23 family metallopeptidase [Woodsholea maritima]
MIKRVIDGPWDALKKRFPERQIYHRSDGEVRYFAITTAMQVAALSVAIVLSVVVAVGVINIGLNVHNAHQSASRLAQMEAQYQQLTEEAYAAEASALALLESQTDEFSRTAGEFRLRHETLRRLLDFAEDLQIGDGSESPSLDGGRVLMAAAPADPAPRASLTPIRVDSPLDNSAESQVTALISEQDAVLARAEDSAESRADNLRNILRLTGLRLDDVIEEGNGEEPAGGPLITLEQSGVLGEHFDPEDPFDARVARIAARILETETLEAALRSTPLARPVGDNYRETSPYGPRLDPFTRRAAFHAGKDFAAYSNAPILATAPGRVVYAGWRSGYGRCVDIDHGYGFMTRYGHLRSIDVRRGDEVVEGQRIGGMGSSGRSTATHLHYEVWFNGETQDPERFLRAGHYVQ